MRLLSLALLVLSFSAFAQGTSQANHLVRFSVNNTFAWSATGTVIEWDKKKSAGIKEEEDGLGAMNLNYHYIFSNRIMAGVELQYINTTSETKLVAGGKDKSEFTSTKLGISGGYNFNEDLSNSWWIKGTLGAGRDEGEFKPAGGVKTKSKDRESFFALSGGKRFSLSGWGLNNVTYSPGITLTSSSFKGDDYKTGKESSGALTLDLIALDVLF